MNKLLKKSLAFLLALVMVLSVVPVFEVSAATVDYETGYDATYGDVIKNWGERGELATFLSPNAEAFYSADFYDTYVEMSGSSDTSTVPSSELYEALYTLMADAHKTQTSYEGTKNLYQYTDCENSGYTSSYLSGFYSGDKLTPVWNVAQTWNREHTWPQSMSSHKGDERDDTADIISLRPETSNINSGRNNKAYGESSGFYNPNIGSYNVHGDVARVILYTYVRWGQNDETLQENIWYHTTESGEEKGVFESVDILLQWMEEDPVDTWEMGRNDSVESITGTRNVFVDYPELAFVLFGEEIPQMDTPSGEAGSVSYTITAQTNNSSYGTVSVNNGYVTAHPAAGYKATGYQVVSGSATVTPNGNIFTVSATGDCTICILFEAKKQYTATFMEDGETASTQTVYEDYCVTMPAYSGTAPDGYTFRGWVDSIVYNTKEKPATVYAAGSEQVLDGNTTFYALMSYVNENDTSGGSLTYKLVTSSDQLSVGASVVIAAAGYDKALSTTQNSNNRGSADISKGTDTLVFDSDDGVQVLTLVAGTVDGTYGFYTGSAGYLYAASSGSNWLRTKTTLDENGSFKITVNSDGTCTLAAQGTNSRNKLYYNTQSNIFSCYAGTSTQVKTISLYAGVAGGTTYYTMAWTYEPQEPTEPDPTVCAHSDCTTNRIEADCTENGSITVVCNACGVTVSQEVIPANGHAYDSWVYEPSCTTDGYTTYFCSECEHQYDGDVVAALGHSVVVDEGYTASCTEDGLTDGSHCDRCDEVLTTQQAIPALGHNYETVVIEPTYDQPGSKTQTCANCGDVITEVIPALGNLVSEWNICLGDTIGVNFHMSLQESDEINITVDGKPASFTVESGVVTVKLAAAKMMDTIAIFVNGEQLPETYSVRQYADVILAGNYDDETKELVKQMLNYGAASQNYFGYNAAKPANSGITVNVAQVPSEGGAHAVSGNISGLTYQGATLVYNSNIAVRFYFTADSLDGISFKVGTTVCQPVAKNGMYYVEFSGINPQNLDQDVNLVVTNGTETMTIGYAPVDYIIRMYNKEGVSDAGKALVQALYGYYLAAEDYSNR